MYKRMKVFCAFLVCVGLISGPAWAEESAQGICVAVKETVQSGKDSKVVVRTAIELGHSACLVIQCALAGGGEPERVMTGAIEAGAEPDVVSRCAVDGGLDPSEVAAILSGLDLGLSLCYFEPDGPEHKDARFDLDGGYPPRRDPFPQDPGERGPPKIISPYVP